MPDCRAEGRLIGEHEPHGYDARRASLERFFDHAAPDWAALTSDEPVGPLRARVRAGRARMRALIAQWLPPDLHGRRILDAGCGTGQLAIDLARRGAKVTGVDVSSRLIGLARERVPPELAASIAFVAGDMLDPALGSWDFVIAMDSLIHYSLPDAVFALATLAPRVRRSLIFTVVPESRLFALARAVERWLPERIRPPAVEMVSTERLSTELATEPRLSGWVVARTAAVSAAFYGSRAVELRRAADTEAGSHRLAR